MKLLATNSQMHAMQTAQTLAIMIVQMESGSTAGVKRLFQAIRNPNVFQQMPQHELPGHVSQIVLPDLSLLTDYDVGDWILHGETVGSFLSATLLLQILGIENLDPALLQKKRLRHLALSQTTINGENVGGHCVLSNAATVVLFDNDIDSQQWASDKIQVNIESALSLKYIASENPSVSLF
jgi:hypothetical protein